MILDAHLRNQEKAEGPFSLQIQFRAGTLLKSSRHPIHLGLMKAAVPSWLQMCADVERGLAVCHHLASAALCCIPSLLSRGQLSSQSSWTAEESSPAQCWLSTNVINCLLPSLHYQQRQRVSNYLQYNLHKCHFATPSTSYFAILCHSNKISQPVGRETHPGDIIINGTGPGFPRAVGEAEEQRRAHSCIEMPSGLCALNPAQWGLSYPVSKVWKGLSMISS